MIAIFGPTGVGKTAVALALARRLRAREEDPVALSADALQVYRGLEVLTGAADAAQQAELEHRLVSFLDVREEFSAGRYAALAHREIDDLLAGGRQPIVVGGTGLYLRAALADLDLLPAVPPEVQAALEARPAGALHAELAARAPHLARRLHADDPRRLARSLALLDLGHEYPPAQDALWSTRTRRPTRLVALVMDRDALDAAIDARVDAMVAAGAVEEVRRAAQRGASRTARQALGFPELLEAAGDPGRRDHWVEQMKRRTRRYARRQLTWLRRLPGARLIDVSGRPADAVAADVDSPRP